MRPKIGDLLQITHLGEGFDDDAEEVFELVSTSTYMVDGYGHAGFGHTAPQTIEVHPHGRNWQPGDIDYVSPQQGDRYVVLDPVIEEDPL